MSYRTLLEPDSGLQGRNIATTAPTDGQALVWNNTSKRWEPCSTSVIYAAISGGTLCSVLFVVTGPVIAQDNANFFWDDTNNRLGIGSTSPDSPLTFSSGLGKKINLLEGGTIGFGVQSGRMEIFTQGGANIFLGQGPSGSMTDVAIVSTGNPALELQAGVSTARAIFAKSAISSTIELTKFALSTSATNTVSTTSTWNTNIGSGTTGNGYGAAFNFQLGTTTTLDQDAVNVRWFWTDATNASRSAAYVIQMVDNAAALAEKWRLAGNGSNTATVQTLTAPSGATSIVGLLEENVTLSTSGATTDSSIQLPANSFILSVTARITTTISGINSTTLSIGDATTAARFGTTGTFTS